MAEEDDDEAVYCVCRNSDISRFMIMCDNCEEWYHGDCIKLTEDESKHIKYYFCKTCRNKDPFLKIKYRKSRKKSREIAEKRKKLKKKQSTEKETKKTKTNDEAPKKLKVSKETTKIISEKKDAIKIKEYDFPKSPDEKETKPNMKFTKINGEVGKRCGKCSNCKRAQDCGICDVCRDKQQGNADEDAVCHLRGCLGPELEEKPSFDEPKISEYDVKVKLEPIVLPRTASNQEAKSDEDYTPESPPAKKQKKSKVKHRNTNIYEEIEFKMKKRKTRSNDKKNKHKPCHGPGCVMPSRRDSKYCSDDCGRRLAAERLYKILPGRINEWHSTPCVANNIGRENLERIRKDMQQAREELSILEMKFRRLENLILRGKTFSIDPNENCDEDDLDDDYPIYCVVCGHSVALKTAVKHMDKCYFKIESQMSFGSVFPTRIEGSQRLFCDTFNAQQQTYCKRLQVLCPEHSKEPKNGPKEVCGCPLSTNFYSGDEPTDANEFCRVTKRSCNKHFKWETMYRAEIDLSRIRQWLKIDEIFEEERKVRSAMSGRGNVVGILLHQTTSHDTMCTDMRTKPSDLKRPAYRFSI